MKKLIFFYLFILLMINPFAPIADSERTKIAVLDFTIQGKGHETEDMGEIVAEWLITALVKEGRFDVIERRLLKKILGEQELGATGVLDQDSVSKLGKLLGVKAIISGSVIRFQNIIEVNARVIDVETASIITAESVKDTTIIGLRYLVRNMAEKLTLEKEVIEKELHEEKRVAASGPSSDYEILTIRFFEGGKFNPRVSRRIYRETFNRRTSRYIYTEVRITNLQHRAREHKHDIIWHYYNPDGSLRGKVRRTFTVNPKWRTAWICGEWGWSNSGRWPVGTYRVKLFIDEIQVGDEKFTIR